MPGLRPFRAVRPAPQLAKKVVSRSYERYNRAERENVLRENPESFLHIVNPGFRIGHSVQGMERRELARQCYGEFLQKGILLRESEPCFYLYEQLQEGTSSLGILCATPVADYQKNLIRRHEATLSRREEIFSSYLQAVRFNAEPVLMMYPDQPKVRSLMEKASQEPTLYEFHTEDGILHRLWKVGKRGLQREIQDAFAEVPAFYIADGHHRSASSNLMALQAAADNSGHTGEEAYNYFMSYLLPESAIRIYPFHRLIRDLNGLLPETFLSKLQEYYELKRHSGHGNIPEPERHKFVMYLNGAYYTLWLRKEHQEFVDPLGSLDSHLLFRTVLRPLLGIEDLRASERLVYHFDKNEAEPLRQAVERDGFAVGFSMAAVSAAEIKAIADHGLVMPPKSTYIEPKLYSGLTIYEF